MPQHWSVSIATQLAFLFVYPDIRDGPPKALDEFSLEEDTSHEKDVKRIFGNEMSNAVYAARAFRCDSQQ